MPAVGRSRRHSLSNPLVLSGLPPAPVPFVDLRFPDLLRRRPGLGPRKEPTSPVDSLLSPDLRFPQGGAGGSRSAQDDGRHNGRRQRSKSVGGQASPDASPSVEDVRGVLSLARQRGLMWPLALAPRLVAAYCQFRDGLQRLRIVYVARRPWVTSPDVRLKLRSLVRAAGPAEMALLPVVFPARRPGGRTNTGAASASDLLTPAVAHELTSRVDAAAATLTRAHRHLDRWLAQFEAVADWQSKVKAGADDATYLAKNLDRPTMVGELNREKDRLLEKLLDRIIPNDTQDLHAAVQNALEFMRQEGLCHKEAELVMNAARPASVPGEEAEKEAPGFEELVEGSALRPTHGVRVEVQDVSVFDRNNIAYCEPGMRAVLAASGPTAEKRPRPRDAGDQPWQREVKQGGEEAANVSAGPSAAAQQAGGDDATSPPSRRMVRVQRLRWAYLRLRYDSTSCWRQVNHAVAVEAFLAFQHDLRGSMAAAAARGKDPSPTTVRLYEKAEASAHGHAEQLDRLAPSPSTPEDDQEEEDESEYDEPAVWAAPSLIDVTIGNSENGEAWAPRVFKSLRQVGSSSGTSRRSGEETEEVQDEGLIDSSSSSRRSSAAPGPTPRGSKHDSGVAGCATPPPSTPCEELMQRAGTATQRRRQKGKGVARG